MSPHTTYPPSAESEVQRTFLGALERAAATDATALLEGESGVGKGWAARRLHERSARAAGPRVVVSLVALAPTLVEAELFGHEAGAFTGARQARLGRFRQAQGGTLVLDDIAALGLDLQAKLLRVLQEREVEPLGGDGPVPIDVRIVATTSRDLAGLVRAGAFREDLYYRLAVFCLRVPSLRERRADIPGLAAELLDSLVARHGLPPRELSAAAIERLQAHSWPGNVRELENALERVLVLESRGPVAAAELSFLELSTSGTADEIAGRALAHGLTLAELEHRLLERALLENQGNVSGAARQVGLTRRAFEYRLSRARRGGHGGHGGDGDEPGDELSEPSDTLVDT